MCTYTAIVKYCLLADKALSAMTSLFIAAAAAADDEDNDDVNSASADLTLHRVK